MSTRETTTTIERLRRLLDSEEGSEELTVLPPDTYVGLSKYAQKLRAAANPNDDDAPLRLARKQLWLMEVMTRRLLQIRLAKAEPASQSLSSNRLLPEEMYIGEMRRRLTDKEERFVKAVVDGQPSFFLLIQKSEAQKMTTVRILRRVGEVIGADLKRYGPFEVQDVARVPAANAKAMVGSGQAAPVSGGDL